MCQFQVETVNRHPGFFGHFLTLPWRMQRSHIEVEWSQVQSHLDHCVTVWSTAAKENGRNPLPDFASVVFKYFSTRKVGLLFVQHKPSLS